MALTLVNELKKRFSNLEFTFAVSALDFEQEKIWAERYSLQVVATDSLSGFLLHKTGFRKVYQFVTGKSKLPEYKNQKSRSFWMNIHQRYMKAYHEADLVIDMMGISYIGDGVRGIHEGLSSFSSFYYAQKHKKPFVRFIQSFGPFDDWKVRIFAQKEFKNLPFIPARGEHSAAYCQQIVEDTDKVYDFPDSAILLPPDHIYAKNFLKNHDLCAKEYVVISPSAVIKNSIKKSAGGSVGDKHVHSFVLFCRELLSRGEKLLFVPHMYSNIEIQSDRAVAKEILEQLNDSKCVLVEEDIDPMQAKALIAGAKYAIVSRYHALVAAVSTGVPVITIGWNIKYQDLMAYYNIKEMAIDMRMYSPEALSKEVLLRIVDIEKQGYVLDSNYHAAAVEKVHTAFDLLERWMRKHA
jgi:polysaccharide pyruvyl transferase WcaK-like protein